MANRRMEGRGTSVPEFFNPISAIEARASDGIELVCRRANPSNLFSSFCINLEESIRCYSSYVLLMCRVC